MAINSRVPIKAWSTMLAGKLQNTYVHTPLM